MSIIFFGGGGSVSKELSILKKGLLGVSLRSGNRTIETEFGLAALQIWTLDEAILNVYDHRCGQLCRVLAKKKKKKLCIIAVIELFFDIYNF